MTMTRQVHFAPQVQCKTTLSRSEMTTKESAAAWYSRKEQVKTIEKCKRQVERRKAGKRPQRNNSYRGLETFQEHDYQNLRQEIDACVYAVMLEQHRQVVERRYDSESLAQASLQHSKSRINIATTRGKYDECEALRILRETEVEEDDKSQSASSVTSSLSSSTRSMQGEIEKLGKVVFATAIECRFLNIKI